MMHEEKSMPPGELYVFAIAIYASIYSPHFLPDLIISVSQWYSINETKIYLHQEAESDFNVFLREIPTAG